MQGTLFWLCQTPVFLFHYRHAIFIQKTIKRTPCKQKGINACISLPQPPRIGVAKFALNLHWSSSNVNFIVDQVAGQPEDYFIDSKDAKSIVHGDITPVQKPMKTWKQREGVFS